MRMHWWFQNQVYASNSSTVLGWMLLSSLVYYLHKFQRLFLNYTFTFSYSGTPNSSTYTPYTTLQKWAQQHCLDRPSVCFGYMLYWIFILAGATYTVKTAQDACANMKKEQGSHSYSVLCVMCDIWNRSQEIPHSLGNSVYKQPL
jgi:hypothetical protein